MSDDLPAVISEISAIQAQMGTQAYTRNDAMQARYRDLLTIRDGQPAQDASPTGQAVMPIASEKEFIAVHGSLHGYQQYLAAARAAADVLTKLGGADLAAINKSFDGLPDDVTQACIAELGSKAPARDLVTDAHIAKFGTTPAGASLIREWGSEARDRLGTLRARVTRAMSKLDEDGQFDLTNWIDDLSDASAKAVFRMLAA